MRRASLRATISGVDLVCFAGLALGDGYRKVDGSITSHVLFALKYNKRVAAVWLLLLVWLLIGMSVPNNADLQKHVN